MASGSVWMIAGRWLMRSIGFVSTVILARLLTPADFGLIAMAMLVIGALQVLAETGQRQAIIRMREPSRIHYDTAWTIGLLIGLVIFILLLILAPLAAHQFDEPRLVGIIRFLALRALIQGFENIGLVDFQRNLDFRQDVKIMVLTKAVGFVITIVLAWLLRDYRALIAGTLVGAVSSVALSYLFSAYRPRFSLAGWREIWSFSGWALVSHIGLYAGDQVDQAVLSATSDAAVVGTYAVGNELAVLPTVELIVPPFRALYAVYAKLALDRPALREHYLAALSFLAIAACATSTGVALVAEDAVQVVLGAQWSRAADVIPWLALAAGLIGIAQSVQAVLLAAGYAWANAWRAIAFALVLLPCSIAGQAWYGAEGVAMVRFVVTLMFAPLMLLMAMRLLEIKGGDLIDVIWRPLVAAATMAGVVWLTHPHLPSFPALRLACDIVCGAAVYMMSLGLLWLVAGQPPGAERTIWAILRARWAPYRSALPATGVGRPSRPA